MKSALEVDLGFATKSCGEVGFRVSREKRRKEGSDRLDIQHVNFKLVSKGIEKSAVCGVALNRRRVNRDE